MRVNPGQVPQIHPQQRFEHLPVIRQAQVQQLQQQIQQLEQQLQDKTQQQQMQAFQRAVSSAEHEFRSSSPDYDAAVALYDQTLAHALNEVADSAVSARALDARLSKSREALAAAKRTAHNLIDARLMMAWARSLHATGDTDRARYVVARLREFRNAAAQDWLDDAKVFYEGPVHLAEDLFTLTI